jgi:hypothetical protein
MFTAADCYIRAAGRRTAGHLKQLVGEQLGMLTIALKKSLLCFIQDIKSTVGRWRIRVM